MMMRSMPEARRRVFDGRFIPGFYLATLAGFLMPTWLTSASQAAIFDAHSGVNGNWSTPTNWVDNAAPTSGSPNLEVRLTSTGTPTFTSVQDLGTPFELQQLSIDNAGAFTVHTVNGSPLAFSNLGAAPIIRGTTGGFLSAPNLVVNADMVLNTNVVVLPNQSIGAHQIISLNGAISGPGGLVLQGGGDVRLGGTAPSTYAGVTNMVAGWLYLEKSPSVTAIAGDLIIDRDDSSSFNRSGRVHVLSDNQIAAHATVTLDGALFVTGGDQTLANLEFFGAISPLFSDGGRVEIGPTRTLTVTGGITRTSNSPAPVFPQNLSFISGGTLDLAGGVRPIHVDNDNPIGLPTTLTISSVIENGGITKTGAGVLELRGDNTYAGNTTVSGGRLELPGVGELLFDLENSGLSNRLTGTATAFLDGRLVIDPASVTDIVGIWNLVDVAGLNESFGPSFGLRLLNGPSFSNLGGGVYRSGKWQFRTTDGNLTLSAVPEPSAVLLTSVALIMSCTGSRHRRGHSAVASTLSRQTAP